MVKYLDLPGKSCNFLEGLMGNGQRAMGNSSSECCSFPPARELLWAVASKLQLFTLGRYLSK